MSYTGQPSPKRKFMGNSEEEEFRNKIEKSILQHLAHMSTDQLYNHYQQVYVCFSDAGNNSQLSNADSESSDDSTVTSDQGRSSCGSWSLKSDDQFQVSSIRPTEVFIASPDNTMSRMSSTPNPPIVNLPNAWPQEYVVPDDIASIPLPGECPVQQPALAEEIENDQDEKAFKEKDDKAFLEEVYEGTEDSLLVVARELKIREKEEREKEEAFWKKFTTRKQEVETISMEEESTSSELIELEDPMEIENAPTPISKPSKIETPKIEIPKFKIPGLGWLPPWPKQWTLLRTKRAKPVQRWEGEEQRLRKDGKAVKPLSGKYPINIPLDRISEADPKVTQTPTNPVEETRETTEVHRMPTTILTPKTIPMRPTEVFILSPDNTKSRMSSTPNPPTVNVPNAWSHQEYIVPDDIASIPLPGSRSIPPATHISGSKHLPTQPKRWTLIPVRNSVQPYREKRNQTQGRYKPISPVSDKYPIYIPVYSMV